MTDRASESASTSREPSEAGLAFERAFAAVRVALSRVHGHISVDDIGLQTSVIDDLGLDSVRFVDLAVTLENLLGIDEFPLQDWYDTEAEFWASPHFTVRSLVAACLDCPGPHREE